MLCANTSGWDRVCLAQQLYTSYSSVVFSVVNWGDSEMDEIDSLLARQKILRIMAKEKYECFVDGAAVGMGHNPMPCILNSVAGQTAKVVIADGHDTGVEMSVPLSSVAVVGGAKMAQAARDLFRS